MSKAFTVGLRRIFLLSGFFLLISGINGISSVDSGTRQISGAGIKGPLAFADVQVFELNPSFPDYYDKTSPISTSTTNQYAEINGLSSLKKSRWPYILVIDGSNATDLNTGLAPVIDKLVTVVTDDMLANGQPIFATPLTTLAFHMARLNTEAANYTRRYHKKKAFTQDIGEIANMASNTFAIRQDANIDILRAPLVINNYTTELADQELAVYHRAAVESFAAKVYALHQKRGITTDAIIQKLAQDLYRDGTIDNADNGKKVGNIDPLIFTQDPMEMLIPNTAYRIKDIMMLMAEERVQIGTNLEPTFLMDAIAYPESTLSTDTSPPAGNSPEVTLSLNSIDFGTLPAGGTSDPIALTLTNSGTAPLNISNVTVSSGFLEANNCNNYVPVGANCIFDIQFSPTTSGEMTGSLTIASDTVNSPDTVTLTGNGTVADQSGTPPPEGSPVIDPTAPEIQFYHDFREDNLGTYTLEDLQKYWGTNSASWSFKDYGTTEIVEAPNNSNHGKAMSVFFKEGGVGYNKYTCCSGTQWRTPVGSHEELYLSYDVMFEEGFGFNLGGKLPGLYWGEFIGGGNEPDGYDGGSGRMMWYPDGEIISYVYHAGMSGPYGDVTRLGFNERKHFIAGQWLNLEIRYVMNTPGVANGIIQAWIDGELVMDRRNFLFRKTKSINLSGLIVTTYFGGSAEKWASPQDQHVFFDNFIVSTRPINH